MMNDPLSDITDYLRAQNICNGSVFVEGFSESAENNSLNVLNLQACVNSESNTQDTAFKGELVFGVYTRAYDDYLCRTESMKVKNILKNLAGKLVDSVDAVTFKRIRCDTDPVLFGRGENNVCIYVSRYTAFFFDRDAVLYKRSTPVDV